LTGALYEVELEPWVRDQILNLPRHLQRAIVSLLARLGEEPRPRGFEKLESDAVRIVGAGCRITFWIDDANRIVTVTRVAAELDRPG